MGVSWEVGTLSQRKIGGRNVGSIGLGCMGMSFAYGPADESESLAVLNRALELGSNFWDTADMYGAGANELLLSKVLETRRDEIFLATKFGNVYDQSMTSHQDLVEAGQGWIVDGTPEYARKCIEASLKRLNVEYVDLYYLHRVDDRVPIEETVGEMARFVQEGKVKSIGISEVVGPTAKKAHSTHPLAAIQNEFSLWTRDTEKDVLPFCAENGIAYVPYSPLGRGFLTGQIKSLDDLPETDWRRMNPRFTEENFKQNFKIVDQVQAIAQKYGATPAQIALAWVLASGEHILPIPGTKRLKYLEENLGADEIELDQDDIEALNEISTPIGDRYPDMTFSNR